MSITHFKPFVCLCKPNIQVLNSWKDVKPLSNISTASSSIAAGRLSNMTHLVTHAATARTR